MKNLICVMLSLFPLLGFAQGSVGNGGFGIVYLKSNSPLPTRVDCFEFWQSRTLYPGNLPYFQSTIKDSEWELAKNNLAQIQEIQPIYGEKLLAHFEYFKSLFQTTPLVSIPDPKTFAPTLLPSQSFLEDPQVQLGHAPIILQRPKNQLSRFDPSPLIVIKEYWDKAVTTERMGLIQHEALWGPEITAGAATDEGIQRMNVAISRTDFKKMNPEEKLLTLLDLETRFLVDYKNNPADYRFQYQGHWFYKPLLTYVGTTPTGIKSAVLMDSEMKIDGPCFHTKTPHECACEPGSRVYFENAVAKSCSTYRIKTKDFELRQAFLDSGYVKGTLEQDWKVNLPNLSSTAICQKGHYISLFQNLDLSFCQVVPLSIFPGVVTVTHIRKPVSLRPYLKSISMRGNGEVGWVNTRNLIKKRPDQVPVPVSKYTYDEERYQVVRPGVLQHKY